MNCHPVVQRDVAATPVLEVVVEALRRRHARRGVQGQAVGALGRHQPCPVPRSRQPRSSRALEEHLSTLGVDSIDIKNLGPFFGPVFRPVFGPILVLYFQFYISGPFSGPFSGRNLCQLNRPPDCLKGMHSTTQHFSLVTVMLFCATCSYSLLPSFS